ncbi:MAG: tetratricopeptide (TPR) repeat protein [Flavobacteriales bacterium]|jgi:tetratricopeptide (TPR) repeat protein
MVNRTIFKVIIITFTSIVALFTVTSSLAANTVDLRVINQKVNLAIKRIKKKQYAQACAELVNLPKVSDLSGSTKDQAAQLQLNIYYSMGQCHAGLGLYAQAKDNFEIVVNADRSQPRPFLDLALTHQYLGEFEQANQQYNNLLGMSTLSQTVRNKVEVLLRNSPYAFKYFVDFTTGVLADNNINNAPSVSSITIYDEEFILNKDNQPISATGINAGLKLRFSKLLDRYSSLSGLANFTTTAFTGNEDHNFTVFDLSAAYHHKMWGGEYSIAPRYANVTIGGSNLLNVLGFDVTFAMLAQQNLRILGKVGYQMYSYSDDSTRDLTEIKPQLIVNYQLYDGLLLSSKLGYSIANAENSAQSSTGVTIDLGVNYAVRPELLLSASYELNPSTYDSELVGFDKIRSDTRAHYNLEASYNLKDYSWQRVTIDIGIDVFEAESNIEIFKNSRSQVYLLFRFTL